VTAIAVLSQAANAVLDLIYPPSCVVCSKGDAWLCERCAGELPLADGNRCRRCWLPLREDGDCRSCRAYLPAFTSLRSAFRNEAEVKQLVYGLKYRGESVLAPSMGRLMAERFAPELTDIDLIVPVPLAPGRQRSRGFNQAERLANAVASVIDRPVVPALKRLRPTASQARSADAAARRRNVEGAFGVRDAAAVQGKRILLIDDVATTGATLDACARPLLAAGATDVGALTFARED
jgi:ComF family protein